MFQATGSFEMQTSSKADSQVDGQTKESQSPGSSNNAADGNLGDNSSSDGGQSADLQSGQRSLVGSWLSCLVDHEL